MTSLQKSDSNLTKHSISCFDVPESLLDKNTAKIYFQQFGRVVRIRLRIKQKYCIVEYANEEDAERALNECGEYNGIIFRKAWTKHKSPDKKSRKRTERMKWQLDPEVQDELNAMKGSFSSIDVPKKPQGISRKTKSQQWKPDKKTKTTEIVTSMNPEQELELLKTIMSVAKTNEEKFRVLDARDKLLRSRLAGHCDLSIAKRAVGTCPDMCPEKERLLRQVQHQVAGFEQLQGPAARGGDLDHSLAVKQYSRSSADQEAALAHELRPVKVLRRTMTHLLRLLDLGDEPEINLAEWYHFLWDRTRAIRKDITQQDLCCEQSVELVEQCARFHIHCAARLVAEDAAVFDAKINSENLTKCLQTLKYMYHDLRVKHQVVCVHEAEFRGYIVLLNLHDGNFMWEVQHLNPEIQRSAEVQFALQVFSAIDNNNFVRFFKLVSTTTYLNACILLRYFHQVRQRALRVLLKVQPPRGAVHSIQKLSEMLGFEDASEAAVFLESHGLELNLESDQVHLDRRHLGLTLVAAITQRARNFVEAKRSVPVSEVVSGAPLPAFDSISHIPQNSFDSDGHLKLSELPDDFHDKYSQYLAQFETNQYKNDKQQMDEEETNEASEVDGEAVLILPSFKFKLDNLEETRSQSPLMNVLKIQNEFQSPVPTLESKPTKLVENDDKHIFVIQTQATVVATELPKPIFQTNIQPLPQKLIVPTIPKKFDFITPVITKTEPVMTTKIITKPISPVIEFQSAIINMQQMQKEKEIRENLLKQQREAKALEEKLKAEKRKQLEEIRFTKELKRKQELAKYDAKIKFEVNVILNIVLNKVEEQLIQNRLKEISENIKKRRVLQFVNRWKNLTKISKKKRKNFFDCPTWNYSLPAALEAQELFTPSQNLILHDLKRYKRGTAQVFNLPKLPSIGPLDIYSLVWKVLFEKLGRGENYLKLNLFWKIGVSVPDLFEVGTRLNRLATLLQNAFDWQKIDNCLLTTKRCYSNNGGSLTYCIKQVINYDNHLNGLLFLILNSVTEYSWERLINRLLKNRTNNVPIPIVVIVKDGDYNNENEVAQQLELNFLLEEGVINSYRVIFCTEIDFHCALKTSLQYLALNVTALPNLEMDALPTFLRKCIGDEFWCRLRSHMNQNKTFEILLHEPNIISELYDKALKKTFDVIFDPNLKTFPKFPPEFKSFVEQQQILLPCTYEYFPDYWNSKSYLNKIRKLLETLFLPKFDFTWPPSNQLELQEILEKYCSKICNNPINMVMKILSKINLNYDFEDEFNFICWTDIVQIIVLEKLANCQFFDKTNTVYTVVYNTEKLKTFLTVPWWYNLQSIQNKIKLIEVNEVNESISEDSEDDYDEINIEETLAEITTDENVDKIKMQDDMKELSVLLDDLEQSMDIQRKIMSKFQSTISFRK